MNHRLLVSDCPNHALLSVDLATGERSVLVEYWPWFEGGSSACVEQVMVDRTGRRAFAIVSRGFQDPYDPDLGCSAVDLVVIDTTTTEVTPIRNIHYNCSDDGGSYHTYFSPQVDAFQQRLLVVESDCDPNFCHYPVSSISLETLSGQRLHAPYTPDCYPDDEDCSGDTWMDVVAMSFDPADPDGRVLLLARRYIAGDYRLDSLELETGALTTLAYIQPLADGREITAIFDLSVDVERQRALLTGRAGTGPQSSLIVLAVELASGSQSLLYDGSPTDDGQQLQCTPNAAFEADERRLLLAEPMRQGCGNGVFAVDADTGAFELLVERIN